MPSPFSVAHPERAPRSLAASSATLPTTSSPAPSVCVMRGSRLLSWYGGEPHLQLALVHTGTGDPVPGEPGGQGEKTTIRPHGHHQVVAVPREIDVASRDQREPQSQHG